jgi:hypothetical protein
VCCHYSPAYSQPSAAAINIVIESTACCCAEKRGTRSIPGISLYTTKWRQDRQHKLNMSADNYLMQEELGSTSLNTSRSQRIHPNISQVAHSASYTALSTNGQANPWR